MRNQGLFAIVAAGMLSACSYIASEPQNHYQGDFMFYQCSAGETFKLALMPNDYAALLRLPKRDYRLIQVPSASGSQYVLDESIDQVLNPVTLHTKGKEARLELGDTVYKNCMTQ